MQHFLFPSGGEGLYLVVDDKSKFREDNFQRAMACLHNGPPELEEKGGGKNRRKSGGKQQNTDLFQIVKLIMDRNLDPCIVFSFSKRDCENYALQMARYVGGGIVGVPARQAISNVTLQLCHYQIELQQR